MMMLMLLPAPSSGNISCVDRPFFPSFETIFTSGRALGAFLFQNGRYILMISYKSSIAPTWKVLSFFLSAAGLHPFVIDHDSGKLQYYTGNLRGWAEERQSGPARYWARALYSLEDDDDDDDDRRRLLQSIYGKASLISYISPANIILRRSTIDFFQYITIYMDGSRRTYSVLSWRAFV